MKTCSRCHKEKSLSEFSKQKHGKFGATSDCKECRREIRTWINESELEKVEE